MTDTSDQGLSRRTFVQGAVAGAVLAAAPSVALAGSAGADKAAVLAQIPKMHAENIRNGSLCRRSPRRIATTRRVRSTWPSLPGRRDSPG